MVGNYKWSTVLERWIWPNFKQCISYLKENITFLNVTMFWFGFHIKIIEIGLNINFWAFDGAGTDRLRYRHATDVAGTPDWQFTRQTCYWWGRNSWLTDYEPDMLPTLPSKVLWVWTPTSLWLFFWNIFYPHFSVLVSCSELVSCRNGFDHGIHHNPTSMFTFPFRHLSGK